MGIKYIELMNLFNKLSDKLDTLELDNSGNEVRLDGVTNRFSKLTKMEQIEFPIVHGRTGGTHPSVEHFPRGWNGYEYWMAYTPYPGVQNENPVIVASNDGYNWVTPPGLINPLSNAPETGYNSDTELVYGPDDKLYCYWRWHTETEQPNVLWRMESDDGVNWTNKTACTLPEGVDPLSPSILVDRSENWQLWIGARGSAKIRHMTSTDGIAWSDVQDCETDIDDFGFHWHPMVWRGAKYYYCLSAFGANGEIRPEYLMTDLYFGKSVDGINWEFESTPLISRGEQGVKNYRVYRSSAVRVGDHHKIYVSGLGTESEQIHVFEAKLLEH